MKGALWSASQGGKIKAGNRHLTQREPSSADRRDDSPSRSRSRPGSPPSERLAVWWIWASLCSDLPSARKVYASTEQGSADRLFLLFLWAFILWWSSTCGSRCGRTTGRTLTAAFSGSCSPLSRVRRFRRSRADPAQAAPSDSAVVTERCCTRPGYLPDGGL